MRYRPGKVVTEATLQCSRRDAWNKVCFYEHISIRPSLLLRLVLPVPKKTTGRYEQVGDISRCCYSDGGYLTKRIRKIVDNERIEFGVIEQSIRFHRTVRLLGGVIEVEDDGDGRWDETAFSAGIRVKAAVDRMRYRTYSGRKGRFGTSRNSDGNTGPSG